MRTSRVDEISFTVSLLMIIDLNIGSESVVLLEILKNN